MSTSNQKYIKELVEAGNGVPGHRVAGSTKAETKNNIRRVFANARQRQQRSTTANLVG